MNPGPPAPQASVLSKLDHGPKLQYHVPSYDSSTKERILNTLISLKRKGLARSTLEHISFILKYLAKHCDLNNPESVKDFIANKNVENSYKNQLVKIYNYYAQINGIEWDKPKYREERRLPKVPTKEQLEKIIASCGKYFATILRILMETGIMPSELSRIRMKDIDLDRGILTVRGYKGHSSRVFKLTSQTVAMLKVYLAKRGNREYPFPTSEWIGKYYRKMRNRLADKLKDPSIKNIRLYDFRHYYATMLYWKTKDILLVKEKLGHKKLETTLIYTQLVDFNSEDEFYTATAKTVKEAEQLIANGWEYITTFNDVMLFRKRK